MKNSATPSSRPRLLTRADLKRMGIKYSNVHLIRLESRNRFPRRLRLSAARVAWLAEEIEAWIGQRAAERADRIYPDYD